MLCRKSEAKEGGEKEIQCPVARIPLYDRIVRRWLWRAIGVCQTELNSLRRLRRENESSFLVKEQIRLLFLHN